jgi:membrane-associated protease RseP (regulator of RpoE activity)
MVLESIGGKGTNINFNDYSYLFLMVPKSNSENITYVMSSLVLSKMLGDYKPGDVVTLKISGANYTLKLGENPNIKGFPYIGIGSMVNVKDISLFLVVFPILGMIASLSFLVGIFNILPIYPLDGGLIVKTIAERFFKKKTANNITLAITVALIAIIIYSIVGGFFH